MRNGYPGGTLLLANAPSDWWISWHGSEGAVDADGAGSAGGGATTAGSAGGCGGVITTWGGPDGLAHAAIAKEAERSRELARRARIMA